MDVATTTFQFDTDAMLSPISVNEPTGESLRYEGTYDLIAALRREDDPNLDQGVWKTDLKKADWPRVVETCLNALETKSKDIQIAAWLMEAWIHLYGFAGVREGLHLIAELCDTYWDGVHPDIVDGDPDYRFAPIQWIDEKLSIAVKLIPITAPDLDDLPACTLTDWEIACRAEGRQGRDRGQPVPRPKFQQSAAATPVLLLSRLDTDISGSLDALNELVSVFDSRCGRDAPRLPRMRDVLASARHLVSTLLEGRIGLLPQAAAPPAPADTEAAVRELAEALAINREAALPVVNGSNGAGATVSSIATRAEAYQRLAEVADFLERIEPHSPVPHLIRKAIRWGSLSLEDLLAELVRDSGQLAEIYRTLQLGEKLRR
jgi:type VI secretion system ImpA family protein